jgi:hypothetical protein
MQRLFLFYIRRGLESASLVPIDKEGGPEAAFSIFQSYPISGR